MIFPVRATVSSRRLPVFTIGLIVANLVVFWHQDHLRWWDYMPFLSRYAFIPVRLQHPDTQVILSIFTSTFLHMDWGHIIGNMWFLWIFGDDVEGKLGRFHFLLFYFVSGTIATLSHYMAAPASVRLSLGASGAISGVLGGYLVMFPTSTITCRVMISIPPKKMEVPAMAFLIFWIMGQIASALDKSETSSVAWYAHIGGFFAGVALALIFRARR